VFGLERHHQKRQPDRDHSDRDEFGPRIMFLTRSLGGGGAERQLVTLALALHQRGWQVSVACFYAGGAFEGAIREAGVKLHELRKKGRWDVAPFLWRLARVIRHVRPDILHSYLSVPNLLSAVLQVCSPRTRVVWGIRASNVEHDCYDRVSRLVASSELRASKFADLFIVNSQSGADYCVHRGLPAEKVRVIPNGIDTDHFQFRPQGRRQMRKLWEVSDSEVLVGLVARLDPMKDHATFLRAAASLAESDPVWRFVCVGGGPVEISHALRQEAERLGLGGRVVWAGPIDDMPAAYSALDIAVSSSAFGEGCPNSIAEAMACGRSCVVTDVGDSAKVVGNMGVVVPPRCPGLLAEGVHRVRQQMAGPGRLTSQCIRARIAEQYTVEALATRTERALRGLV